MYTEKLFEVTKLRLHTGLEGFDSPEAYGVFKTTGGPALGVVGKDFTPTQPQFIHVAKFKSKDDFIYADSGLFMNNKAQKFALELLN